jgi:hypothetical protein
VASLLLLWQRLDAWVRHQRIAAHLNEERLALCGLKDEGAAPHAPDLETLAAARPRVVDAEDAVRPETTDAQPGEESVQVLRTGDSEPLQVAGAHDRVGPHGLPQSPGCAGRSAKERPGRHAVAGSGDGPGRGDGGESRERAQEPRQELATTRFENHDLDTISSAGLRPGWTGAAPGACHGPHPDRLQVLYRHLR